MKMSTSTSESEGLTPQLQAELADFEDVLREFNIDLNIANQIPLTSQEYEDSMQVLEEFLQIQDGFTSQPESNPSVEQLEQPIQQPLALEQVNNVQRMEDVAINFSTPGFSAAELIDIYLADVDIETELTKLNLEPDCNMDLNTLELDDLFFKSVDNTSPPNDKPVLVAEKPQSSEDVLVEPENIDGDEHQYGHPPVLIAQVCHNDLRGKEELPVDIMFNHIPIEDIPTDTEDVPTGSNDVSTEPEDNSYDNEDTLIATDNIPIYTDCIPIGSADFPINTDDVSTEPEDNSTDNESTPKNISTDPFATLPGSFWDPFPYTINTWMMNREKERKEKHKRKGKKTASTSPTSTIRPSGTTSHPRRKLFFENRKEASLILESGSPPRVRTRKTTKEKTSLCKAVIKKKVKKTKQPVNNVVKVKKERTSTSRRRRSSTECCRTCSN